MKRIKLFLLMILLTSIGFSQEVTIVEPDFEGQIIYVNQDNTPMDLEMQTCSIKTGKSVGRMVTGVGKVKARIVVNGSQSSTKIKTSDNLNFVYNNGSNDILPQKVVQLLEFTQQGDTREYLVASSSNVSGQTNSMTLDLIPFKGKKYGEHSYLISISNLPIGEYGFFLGEKESRDVFLFSVIE